MAMSMGNAASVRQDMNDTRGEVLSERSAESRARLAAQLRESEKRDKTTGYWRAASTYTKDELYAKVTLIIKTFEREPCLLPYIKSVREFYPGLRILVADDSRQIAETEEAMSAINNLSYFALPFDTGVSAGRNFLLDHVGRPFSSSATMTTAFRTRPSWKTSSRILKLAGRTLSGRATMKTARIASATGTCITRTA